MTPDERRQRLLAIAERTFGVARGSLTIDAGRDDVASWDSLNHLLLFMALERELGVRFSTEDIGRYRSLEEIESRLAAG